MWLRALDISLSVIILSITTAIVCAVIKSIFNKDNK